MCCIRRIRKVGKMVIGLTGTIRRAGKSIQAAQEERGFAKTKLDLRRGGGDSSGLTKRQIEAIRQKEAEEKARAEAERKRKEAEKKRLAEEARKKAQEAAAAKKAKTAAELKRKQIIATRQKLFQKSTVLSTPRKTGTIQLREKIVGIEQGVPTKRVVAVEDGVERRATQEEFKAFIAGTKTVEAVPEPKGLIGKATRSVEVKRAELLTEKQKSKTGTVPLKSELASIGIGAAASGISTVTTAKQFITSPIETTKATATGGTRIVTQLATGKAPAEFAQIGKVIRTEPGFALGFVGGEIVQAKAGAKAVDVALKSGSRLATRLSPRFRKVKTTPLGERTIVDIPSTKFGKSFDIELIPGRGQQLPVDPLRVVKETDLKFKKKPSVPRLTKDQQKIINVVKGEGDIVAGSLGENIVLSKSRKFADIDILAKKPQKTARLIKGSLGKGATIKKGKTSLKVFKGKKQIADVVPFKVGEEGFARRFGIIEVDNLKVLRPEARLASKVKQLGRQRKIKVVKDVARLTGENLDKAAIKGAYGFTRKQQLAFIGKKGPVATSAKDLFKPLRRQTKILQGEGGKGLFATPFDIKTKKAQTRISRLGVDDFQEARLLDVISDDIAFKRPRSQIVVFEDQVIGKNFQPLGFPTSELEVTLPPGKIIRKTGKKGVSIINKQPVSIITAEVIDPTSRTKTLSAKAATKGISKAESVELSRRLSRETGFSPSELKELRRTGITPVISRGRQVTTIGAGLKGINRDLTRETDLRFEPRTITRLAPRRGTPKRRTPRRAGRREVVRRAPRVTEQIRRIDSPIRREEIRRGTSPQRRPLRRFPRRERRRVIRTPIPRQFLIGPTSKGRTFKVPKQDKFEDDLAVAGGFTAKALGLRRRIKASDIGTEAGSLTGGIGIRGIPQIIN